MGKTQDIRAAVKDELSFDPLIDPAAVTVENLGGEVALNGTVPSYPQYLQAATAASAVAGLIGVRNIDNEIYVSNDAGPGDVTQRVQEALDRYALILDDSDVTVNTDLNTVWLTGHVSTWAEHDAVAAAAWMAPGVYDVRDDLYVTG